MYDSLRDRVFTGFTSPVSIMCKTRSISPSSSLERAYTSDRVINLEMSTALQYAIDLLTVYFSQFHFWSDTVVLPYLILPTPGHSPVLQQLVQLIPPVCL